MKLTFEHSEGTTSQPAPPSPQPSHCSSPQPPPQPHQSPPRPWEKWTWTWDAVVSVSWIWCSAGTTWGRLPGQRLPRWSPPPLASRRALYPAVPRNLLSWRRGSTSWPVEVTVFQLGWQQIMRVWEEVCVVFQLGCVQTRMDLFEHNCKVNIAWPIRLLLFVRRKY